MDCAEAARLLGIAWVGAGLYPDPASQDSFRRVAEELSAIDEPLDFEPGPEELRCRKKPLEELGGALKRFSMAAFGHNIAVLRLHPGFSPEHLASFLQLVAVEPAALEGIGGLAAAVRARDLTGIDVALQASLVKSFGGGSTDDSVDLAQLIRKFNSDLPSTSSLNFVEEFSDIVDNQPDQVHAYLEAFTRLDKPTQEAIVTRLLGESGRELQELFLNQLAGHELAELKSSLGSHAAALLADYVEYSTGQRGVEAENAILDPDSLLTFRSEVAERVNSRLRELDVTGFGKAIEMPPIPSWTNSAQETMRGIFKVEQRPDKRDRAARAWSRLVSSAIRRGAFAEALDWYDTGADLRVADPDLFDREFHRLADGTLPTLAMAMASGNEAAVVMLDRLAPANVKEVVLALELDEMASKREPIIERLPDWLAGDIRPVLSALPSLDKSVAAVLGLIKRSGKPVGGDERVRARLEDKRPEVRLLALDLCSTGLTRKEVGAFLHDSAGPIRRAALRILAQDDSDEAVATLAKALDEVHAEERVTIASALARSKKGMAYLHSLGGGWRGVLTAEGRSNRALVKKVLG